MNKTTLWTLVIIILIALGLVFIWPSLETGEPNTEPADGALPFEPMTLGTLDDVTNGEVVRGITTSPNTTGTARAGFDGDIFIVEADFFNLPDPVGDDFYEGWIVRRGEDFSVISTGVLTREDVGTYTNVFTSNTDLLDHTVYILTLEPNDGDPAPADHILEGELMPQ